MGDECVAAGSMLDLLGEGADSLGRPEPEHRVWSGVDIPKHRALMVLYYRDQCLLGDQLLLRCERHRRGDLEQSEGNDKPKRAHRYLSSSVLRIVGDGTRERERTLP